MLMGVGLNGLNLKLYVSHVNPEKVHHEQKEITLGVFDEVAWKARHTLKAIFSADGFAEGAVPYFLFFTALALAGMKLIGG